MILLANEFLDCLPIRQAVRGADGWRERRIGRQGFEAAEPVAVDIDGPIGAIFEWSPAVVSFGLAVADLIARASGAALFIDYGRDRLELGDTLQALRGHRKECPLENPGHADITAHVDFPALPHSGPIFTQAEFLRRLGIEARAAALSRANPDDAGKIGRQLARLTSRRPDGDAVQGGVHRLAGPDRPGVRMSAPPTLRSAMLDGLAGVRHAFFTRRGGISTGVYESLNLGAGSADDPAAAAENRRRAAAVFGAPPERLNVCYQIHSTTIATVRAPWDGERPRADGVVSAAPGLICGALSADCAPVLLADPEARVAGAVHAGWRGALAGVIEARRRRHGGARGAARGHRRRRGSLHRPGVL